MNVYSKENKIKDLILKNSTKASLILEDLPESITVADEKLDTINFLRNGIEINSDSFWLSAILVTTNWNRNDDVFSPEEVAKAKSTPKNKPVNWLHNASEDDNEIIGVITSCEAVDNSFRIIDPNVNLSNLEKYHLAIGMLVWQKYFPEYAKLICDGVSEKDLFVSTEAIFDDFGYALKLGDSNDIILMDRTENNCGLTSYLRSYGGTGKVTIDNKEYKIGRWLKKITFSGVGYVYTPANTDSILLSDKVITSNKRKFVFANLIENLEKSVLNIDVENNTMKTEDNKSTKIVASEDVVSAEQAKAMDELKASYDATVAELKAQLVAAKDEIAAANDKLKAMKDEMCASASKAEATAKEFGEVKAKLEKIEKTKVGMTRLETLKSLNAVEDDEKALAELMEMSDKEFDRTKNFAESAFKKTTEMSKTNLPKTTDQTKTSLKESTQAVAEAKIEVNTEVKEEAAIKTVAVVVSNNDNEDLVNFVKNLRESNVNKKK